MDYLLVLMMALSGFCSWIAAAMRPGSRRVVRILCGPACLWLGFYALIALGQATPDLWSGRAEIGHVTLGLIILGLLAYAEEPKRFLPDDIDGGEQSA